MLQIHNSLTGQKQVFEPIEPGHVRMYVCGITVYDYCHVGHGRMLTVFDVVRRHLQASGYEVTFVRNVTDIDDKIIRRAEENRETTTALTERFTEAYRADCAARSRGVAPSSRSHCCVEVERVSVLDFMRALAFAPFASSSRIRSR